MQKQFITLFFPNVCVANRFSKTAQSGASMRFAKDGLLSKYSTGWLKGKYHWRGQGNKQDTI
jgi:hypothetical protein